MSDSPIRKRLIEAASRLFYAEGIGRVSVDAVAAKAGVTKRTLYYHFRSKDDLVAAYLEGRDQPNLRLMAQWYNEAKGRTDRKVAAIFEHLALGVKHPKWKGCGFLRTVFELAPLPGHPAVKIGSRHKAAFEVWLAGELNSAGLAGSAKLARQILVLMDGGFATSLLHRDAAYMEAAGEAAAQLVRSARRARK